VPLPDIPEIRSSRRLAKIGVAFLFPQREMNRLTKYGDEHDRRDEEARVPEGFGRIRRGGWGVQWHRHCERSANPTTRGRPDEHVHEHATCFNVKDKGLVVISSCGHVGIVNSVRQAQEVSGVRKVHAIVGGFHLGPAPQDYLDTVVAEIKKLEPDVIIPMHCSGNNFIQAMREQMPDNLIVTTTGSRIAFGA